MPIDATEVEGQAGAFLNALERMTPKERQGRPNQQYGERFNEILEFAKEAMPNVDNRLWPKPLQFTRPQFGPPHVEGSYVEIETYARQILAIIVR
jgi:hypothetical protein